MANFNIHTNKVFADLIQIMGLIHGPKKQTFLILYLQSLQERFSAARWKVGYDLRIMEETMSDTAKKRLDKEDKALADHDDMIANPWMAMLFRATLLEWYTQQCFDKHSTYSISMIKNMRRSPQLTKRVAPDLFVKREEGIEGPDDVTYKVLNQGYERVYAFQN